MLILVLVSISYMVLGQIPSEPIFYYKPYTDSIETNIPIDSTTLFNYNIQYQNLKNANVENEVTNAVRLKDLRFISISGVGYLYPGLEGGYDIKADGSKVFIALSSKYKSYLKNNKFKVVKGTSDAMNLDAPPLQFVAYEFAKKYNLLLIEKLKN